jgi:hypothetical protein
MVGTSDIPPLRLVSCPCASRTRVVPAGAGFSSAYPGAAGSETGRRERQGAPTISTPGTISNGLLSVTTVT